MNVNYAKVKIIHKSNLNQFEFRLIWSLASYNTKMNELTDTYKVIMRTKCPILLLIG